jgi:hypothetical protein
MIIFEKTRQVGHQKFLVFRNEHNAEVSIPLGNDQISLIIHYFDRLSPSSKVVEPLPDSEE